MMIEVLYVTNIYSKLLYKMGHYFLDIQYKLKEQKKQNCKCIWSAFIVNIL